MTTQIQRVMRMKSDFTSHYSLHMSRQYRNQRGPNAFERTNSEMTTNTEDDEEAHEFATYVESDDDDEDPYFMPEHNKKSSTLSISSLSCSPVQLFRFLLPATCILIIIVYTTVVGVLVKQKRLIPETLNSAGGSS